MSIGWVPASFFRVWQPLMSLLGSLYAAATSSLTDQSSEEHWLLCSHNAMFCWETFAPGIHVDPILQKSPEMDWTCSSTSHGCSARLGSGEFGSWPNALNWAVFPGVFLCIFHIVLLRGPLQSGRLPRKLPWQDVLCLQWCYGLCQVATIWMQGPTASQWII